MLIKSRQELMYLVKVIKNPYLMCEVLVLVEIGILYYSTEDVNEEF